MDETQPLLVMRVPDCLMSSRLVPILLLGTLMIGACRSARTSLSPESASELRDRVDSLEALNDSLARAASLRNPNLHSTLWAQTSVEYTGTARQAYALAEVRMRQALADSTWTAALEQAENGSGVYRDKPPAVVLDVDETVLDNSAYQARLIRNNAAYSSETWKAWVREERAGAVPGALGFTQAAVRSGVQVIYLTNRDADVEESTRDNLKALGFPIDDAPDAVLTQGEMEGWGPKSARRAWVAERYRILLLIGDNFGDFVAQADTTVAARRKRSHALRRYWGTRWIVLPNAQYGSWEGALYHFNYDLPTLQTLEEKHDHLNPQRPN
ncbi:MAG: 5'-nucleotidase, lipoprotein e(P4) family [Salinibacter sp.]|uniref:5'-nucleotidase, lipoprotein e(P4) family n=1 Tax=Salinibacter sp. TaxID=2065818 RepID=UPI0035D4B3B3